jgi:hypothetical protein
MPKQNNINGIHAQRLKSIRSFVNFDYDLRKPLSRHQKRKIKTYFDEIDALTARPYHAYRPRSKAHLKKAQEFAQHEKRLPGLKVAFIPTNGIEKPKIRFTKSGELIAETEHVRTRFLEFDPLELIESPIQHTEDVIAKDKQAKSFTILAGRYEIPNSYSRERVGAWVSKFAEKYSNQDANNYFGNWMVGLNAHHFKEQASFDEYREAKAKAKKDLQRKRRNKKRRKSK